MRKQILYLLLFLSSSTQTFAQVITVSNPTDDQRQELAEIRLQDLSRISHINAEEPFCVVNSIGQEIDFQVTFDGKLLFDASVMPQGKAQFRIEHRTPYLMLHPQYGDHGWQTLTTRTPHGGYGVGKVWTSGRYYEERLDDIAWENDRGAYRVYGPAFEKSGNHGYGPDVWVKNTPQPDIHKRYRKDIDIKPIQKMLETSGRVAEAEKLVQDNSFHLDHGTGNDCYAVGPTLGCGAPAIISDGKIIYPRAWKTYEILDNGPLRFTLALTYADTIIGNTHIQEHRIYTLDKGSNFNKVEVWYQPVGSPTHGQEKLTVAAGFPLHAPNEATLQTGEKYIQYADPTDNPSYNNSQLYIACLFPYNDTKAITTSGHALRLAELKPGEHMIYYAGSAWSKYDVRNQKEWQARINTTLQAIATPLKIEIE